MPKVRFVLVLIPLIILVIALSSCTKSTSSLEKSREIAEEFVKMETTFRYDGISDTLKVTGTISIAQGWRFTIEFDSQHPGYGNRTGQVIAQVLTHHVAEMWVQSGQATKAIMDGVWDMVNGRMLDDVEIELAPIQSVDVLFKESYPIQVGVNIKIGFKDGCTTFHDSSAMREANTIYIEIATQRPRDQICPAIYTFFDKNINLGSDFKAGATYTLIVNDYTTTFVMPR